MGYKRRIRDKRDLSYPTLAQMLCKRILLILIVTFYCYTLSAQQGMADQYANKVDSLLNNNKWQEADKFTESLYLQPHKTRKRREAEQLKLELLYQKLRVQLYLNDNQRSVKILRQLIKESQKGDYYNIEFRTHLKAALLFEVLEDFLLCRQHLEAAKQLALSHPDAAPYSAFCVRMSSYYRQLGKEDSATAFAKRGLQYAELHGQHSDMSDAYLLLGNMVPDANYKEAIRYQQLAQKEALASGNKTFTPYMYGNIARCYLENNDGKRALKYIDSSLAYFKMLQQQPTAFLIKTKANVLASLGEYDSAYIYMTAYHQGYEEEETKNKAISIKKITAQYEIEGKEATIKDRNQWLIFVVSLAAIVLLASIILLMQNTKIKYQNNLIHNQLIELSKLLEQKEVLLAELQHRVKNNLLQVISLLEIQKESLDFNSLSEVIRETQNRVHAMALLHSMLTSDNNLKEIYVQSYLSALADLVIESYTTTSRDISAKVSSSVDVIGLDLALPLGQILVELISNSLKHGFEIVKEATIEVQFKHDLDINKYSFCYQDNGSGFKNDAAETKGLGLEIIEGLVEQLGGKVAKDRSLKKGFNYSFSC